MDKRKQAIAEMANAVLSGQKNIDKLKKDMGKKFRISEMIKNSEILAAIPKNKRTADLIRLLQKRPMRTLSGVTPVAVMIKPEGSCGFSCIYCPKPGKGPKSYTGEEPAALRARECGFDAYKQVKSRLAHYEQTGHNTQKCEIIIMGGTFLRTPKEYQRKFVKGIYDALNGRTSKTLEDAIRKNETAKHRSIGLTIETRPDVCNETDVDVMLSYGATRVELGVQHPSDRIYKLVNRGHTVANVIKATKILKNAAFKVAYHIMPGLPGSNPKKDIAMVKHLFSNQDFRPDMLKIYPTLVIPGTELEKITNAGKYTPLKTEEAAEVISEFYRHIPPYVRVMRIQRDIPSGLISEGVKKSNLREWVDKRIAEKKIKNMEIRSREAGLTGQENAEFRMKCREYDASDGKEIFISFENKKSIAGFLRLRFQKSGHRKEITGDTALVRELHIYGIETPLAEKGEIQHRGFGSKLLQKAETIAKKKGMNKITVISGVGVREYYKKRGYKKDGPYMSKRL